MKQKVLIVEDNISLSQRQKDWLEQAGFTTHSRVRVGVEHGKIIIELMSEGTS